MKDKYKRKLRKEDSYKFGICSFKILRIILLLFYLISFESCFQIAAFRIMKQNHHCSNNVLRKNNIAFQSICKLFLGNTCIPGKKFTLTKEICYAFGLCTLMFLIIIFSVHFPTWCDILLEGLNHSRI